MPSSSPMKHLRVRALAVVALSGLLACDTKEAPPAAPAAPAAPAPPPPAAPSAVDGGRADARLGMMERHAIWKAKKEADAKLAA